MDPYAPLFALLREGREHLKIALECRVPATGGNSASHSTDDEHAGSRIFAVVSNIERGHEEFSLFVLKRRRKDANRVKVVAALPVLPHMTVEVSDYRGDDERQSTCAPSSAGRSGMECITISLSGQKIVGLSDDARGIKDLSMVLQEAASNAQMPSLNTDADEDARTQDSQIQSGVQVHDPDVMLGPHAWMSNYIDLQRTMSPSTAAPIFSRFTKSAILPPASDRPVAPSPSADEIKVSFGTWNVNGAHPSPEIPLDPWLHIVEDDPDVVVVGLEEADSSSLSYVMWTPHVETIWSQAIELSMGRQAHEYEKLASKQLAGLLMLVYVKRTLRPKLSHVGHAAVGVGFGGWAANKGAAALRFELDDATSFCFVVSHLSAFEGHEALERRRWDYQEITRRLKIPVAPRERWHPSDLFDDSDSDEESVSSTDLSRSNSDSSEPHSPKAHRHLGAKHVPRKVRRKITAMLNGDNHGNHHKAPVVADALSTSPDSSVDAESMLRAQLQRDVLAATPSQSSGSPALHRFVHILEHDVVFWGGDLNFRVELNTSETKRLIPRQQYEDTLLKFDQLRNEMRNSLCFDGFREQRILFAPTYKFDRGTDVYDTSEKQRCPSWTDRVLWRERAFVECQQMDREALNSNDAKPPSKRVTPIAYESCAALRISDHKPVLATFIVNVGRAPFSQP